MILPADLPETKLLADGGAGIVRSRSGHSAPEKDLKKCVELA
jgi:hypothetical protein